MQALKWHSSQPLEYLGRQCVPPDPVLAGFCRFFWATHGVRGNVESEHACVCAHVTTRVCMCLCMHVCIRVHVYVCACMSCVYVCVRACACVGVTVVISQLSSPVYIHMSKGFIFLALALCLILLPTMFLSFRPVCRRLNKIDFLFSFLSIGIGKCRKGQGCLGSPPPPRAFFPELC